MSDVFFCGQELRAKFPFVKTTYEVPPDDPEGQMIDAPTWRPGVNFESDGFDGTVSCADADGEVAFVVIAVFKPGSYPERIFYLRNWIDPDGKRFGKNKLRITTRQHFRSLIKGYRHDYEFYEGSA